MHLSLFFLNTYICFYIRLHYTCPVVKFVSPLLPPKTMQKCNGQPPPLAVVLGVHIKDPVNPCYVSICPCIPKLSWILGHFVVKFA